MRTYLLLFAVMALVLIGEIGSYAQTPLPSPSPTAVAASPDLPSVQVAEPAAPPKWAEDLIVYFQKLPVVGPIVTKGLVYLGIVSAILTALVGFLLLVLSSLSGVFNTTGLAGLSKAIEDFKNGPIMYWLKYLSMFNANKQSKPSA